MRRRLRLRHPDDFARLKRAGRVIQHPYFLLSYAPNELDHNRYGVVIGKRHGKAVVRNRTRRLLKEATRLLHPRLQQGFDIVFIVRHALIGKPFALVQRNVFEVLSQAELFEDTTR